MISKGLSSMRSPFQYRLRGNRPAVWLPPVFLILRKVLPKVRLSSVPYYIFVRSQAAFLPGRPLLFPYFMQIEPTTRCDLECRFCPRESLPIRKGDITLKMCKTIIDHNPFIVAILLQGLGEPLLHPEIEEIIRYGRSKRIFMGICTNGMHLTGEHAERLMQCGLNYLAISVDGTGDAFEAMRGGARFDLLVKHLSELRKREIRGCVMGFWMRLSQWNHEQALPVLDLARAFGIEHVHFQDLQYKQDSDALNRFSLSNSLKANDKKDLLKLVRSYASRKGIVSTFDPLDRNQQRTHCTWPWEGIYVDYRGDVWPCCVAWEQGFTIGNIVENPLSKIWRNKNYTEFRLALRDGPLPRICKACRFL